MTKPELEKVLTFPQVPLNECTPEDIVEEAPTRIHFWEYRWEPLIASSSEYNTKVTYQVSVISEFPRCKEIIELKHRLDKLDLHPIIEHEKDIESRRWHSYFAIEVLENV